MGISSTAQPPSSPSVAAGCIEAMRTASSWLSASMMNRPPTTSLDSV